MTTERTLSIQRAIGNGQEFWAWWITQDFWPQKATYSKDIAHIYFDEQTQLLKSNLKRFKQLIVTDEHGNPPEHFKFVIHSTPAAAEKHGQQTIGKKKFRILTFSQFKLTPTFRIMSARIALKAKWEARRLTEKPHVPMPLAPPDSGVTELFLTHEKIKSLPPTLLKDMNRLCLTKKHNLGGIRFFGLSPATISKTE